MQDSKLKFLTLLSFKLSAVKWVLWLSSNTSKAGARVIPGHELRSHMPHRAMKKGGGGAGSKNISQHYKGDSVHKAPSRC